MKQQSHCIERLETRQLLAGYPVSIGSNAFDSAYAVAATGDGGCVVAGVFKGTIDLNPTSGRFLLTALGDTDIYVARYNADGRLVWGRRIGGIEGELNDNTRIDTATDPRRAGPFDLGVGVQTNDLGEYVSALEVDNAGSVYMVGAFRGVVDFDPAANRQRVLTSTEDDEFLDIFMLKLNASGNLIYANNIGGRFTDVANGLHVQNNEMYISGYYTRRADFDPGSGTTLLSTDEESRENAFVARYNATGGLVWTRQIATNDIRRDRRTVANDVVVDSAGNVYAVGSYSGEGDFDPTAGQNIIEAIDGTDTFVWKLNNAGTFQYVRTFGGEEYDGALHAALSPDESRLYVASYFEEIIDADPSPSVTRPVFATPEEIGDEAERSDVLISSFNPTTGSLNWAKSFGADAYETIGGIAADINNNGVFITGGFYGSADFDPGRGRAILTSTLGVEDFDDANDDDRDNSYDAYVWKLDANGRYVFATRFGAASDDYGTAIDVDPSTGNIFIAGQFKGTVAPTSSTRLRPTGKEDSFVSLYSAMGDLLA